MANTVDKIDAAIEAIVNQHILNIALHRSLFFLHFTLKTSTWEWLCISFDLNAVSFKGVHWSLVTG